MYARNRLSGDFQSSSFISAASGRSHSTSWEPSAFLALQPVPRPELRKALAQPRQAADKLRHVVVRAAPRPVHPADLVVLTIRVVVAALRVADLVAGQDQRHALRQHERRQLIAAQEKSMLQNRGVVGRSLDAAVEAVVVVGAVAIVFLVRLVVLVLVADQIGEREAVVDGDMIDLACGPRPSWRIAAPMRSARWPCRRAGRHRPPVAPQRLAIDVVPLRPAGRKAADLIAAKPDVPRFGDQLDVGENRILPDRGEEHAVRVERRGAAERRGEIEAEAVDVEHLDQQYGN